MHDGLYAVQDLFSLASVVTDRKALKALQTLATAFTNMSAIATDLEERFTFESWVHHDGVTAEKIDKGVKVKAARYERLSPGPEHRRRLLWEDHAEEMVDMPAHIAVHLPKRKARLN